VTCILYSPKGTAHTKTSEDHLFRQHNNTPYEHAVTLSLDVGTKQKKQTQEPTKHTFLPGLSLTAKYSQHNNEFIFYVPLPQKHQK